MLDSEHVHEHRSWVRSTVVAACFVHIWIPLRFVDSLLRINPVEHSYYLS